MRAAVRREAIGLVKSMVVVLGEFVIKGVSTEFCVKVL
jgi:hypothetical protein